MATLENLKQVLRKEARARTPSPLKSLSQQQYSDGFDTLQDAEWTIYQDFVIPHLSQQLNLLLKSRLHISALEIGPGPKSMLGYLPYYLRQKIRKFTAFESNGLLATKLNEWLSSTSEATSPLPYLENPPTIHRTPFSVQGKEGSSAGTGMRDDNTKYDIILFCHSMYGMKPKRKFIKRALEMLAEGGIVVVFHRDAALHFDGLVCDRTAVFPTGVVRVANVDEVLDCFASFIAGFNVDNDEAIRVDWRNQCRALGRLEEGHPDPLSFSSPNIMVTFTQHATALPELTAQMLSVKGDETVKNREARLQHPALIMRPTEIQHVQQCVRWALKHGAGLIVLGGGHSGHCLWPNVVSIDMAAFDQIHILTAGKDGGDSCSNSNSLVVVEAGCKTGDIIRKTMAAGVTVPLGARPSVGAGLYLQGGIGHLSRLHGLACDAIVGAIIVSVVSGQIFCVGHVPSDHRPADAIRPENESELLWAIKGAGTNFNLVVSVTFKSYPAPIHTTRKWVVPLSDSLKARRKLNDFDDVATQLPPNCSADAYLFWEAGQLHLGVTMFESSTTGLPNPPMPIDASWGPEETTKTVDGVGLFDAEMYVSGMHGGHGSGKTSSFKRCLFLKNIGGADIASRLVAAMESRPSPFCYLHLLQGGGAIGDVAPDATAFGCRDWDFACVITGIWPRDQDGTEAARSTVKWVYDVVQDLLPLSSGAYGADLGPDPRDASLATKAFGPNRPRLGRLKSSLDPRNVLAYACPLPKTSAKPKLIFLVTGESCAGKDYCAEVWVSLFTKYPHKDLITRAVSISDVTKQEYAAATKADLSRLLRDRAYKEEHRPALTRFFEEQMQQRPQLPAEHFLSVVHNAADVDVLLITGMRDEAPLAAFSHLVPDSRLVEVHVQASGQTRQVRRGRHGESDDNKDGTNAGSDLPALSYRPSFTFVNETTGDEAAKSFAEKYLLPFLHEDLQRLANMVRSIPNFPRPSMEFRHVLGISQQPGGLALCTSLLQKHFTGDWAKIQAVACCEVGGFVYASALASRVDVPLVLIREAGKLPPPTFSVVKPSSYISSPASKLGESKRIEMERDVIPRGASVVVVDDVLSTGETLCAVLKLLGEAGVRAEDISVMVMAEFPVHRGRDFLRRHGFGRVNVQSLLVFDGD